MPVQVRFVDCNSIIHSPQDDRALLTYLTKPGVLKGRRSDCTRTTPSGMSVQIAAGELSVSFTKTGQPKIWAHVVVTNAQTVNFEVGGASLRYDALVLDLGFGTCPTDATQAQNGESIGQFKAVKGATGVAMTDNEITTALGHTNWLRMDNANVPASATQFGGGGGAILETIVTDVYLSDEALAQLLATLASTATGKGASLVGVVDTANVFTATTVEAALKELYDSVQVAASPAGWRDKNYLINGGFAFAQRQAPGTLTTYSNTSGRSYGADRWGMTNENASMQFQRIDSQGSPESSLFARYYGRFKKITSAGKMVVSQVVEGTEMMPLRGKTVRFQAKMRYTVASSMVVRLGLLQLTNSGTIDTIPATFVSAFGASGTDPTFGTNLSLITPASANGGTISGSGVTCTLTGSWVTYSATFVVPSNCKNLIPVIWTNGQPAASDELNIAEAGLYDGSEVREWVDMPFNDELQRCQRFYFKTFDLETAPVQNAGNDTGEYRWQKINNSVNLSPFFFLPVRMRSIQTASNTTFNPAAANAQIRNTTRVADTSSTVMPSPPRNDRQVAFTWTNAVSEAAGDDMRIHFTLDAEL